ncbi:hypothetical protein [Billgrantia gudaonensis]|uniref:Uncharacterized protein n=1 Tax=Billgrantia gudaonensis TaxID=376427 RepID=A0A1G8R1A7_9GAMM|nr:hypothetical protein [Halomonas gudaonensis]SDJ10737.1 hypothetical protein SAMN04487954_10358 [Halomonas gudaonensis]
MIDLDEILQGPTPALVEAINATRYALAKQIDTLTDELGSNYGPLELTTNEAAAVRELLHWQMKRRLARLEFEWTQREGLA